MFRQVLRRALDLYFVDIQSTGRELIPPSGPVIFAANHPNSIMDTVILGTQTDRTVSYMARSGLFGFFALRWLFNACGVIPVYRAQDNPAQLHRNQGSFDKAYEVLGAGGTIGIFPEGRNAPARHVRAIKTGTARIALGAEAAAGFGLGVQIVPVGLNFVQRDRFLSSVLIRFGTPLDTRQWADAYREDERGAVRDLTDTLQDAIRGVATHMEDDRTTALARDIYSIYGSKLLRDLVDDWGARRNLVGKMLDHVHAVHDVRTNLDDVFWVQQRIADAIAHFQGRDPVLMDRIEREVELYKSHLAQSQLRHDFMDRRPETLSVRRESIKFTAYAMCLAPLAAWGLLGNAPAYLLMRFAALHPDDEAQRAIWAFGAGLMFFPAYWGAQVWGLFRIGVPWWWCAVHFLTLPFAGFFFLRYRRQLARYRRRILTRTLFLNDRLMILNLAAKRQRLLNIFDSLRRRFVEAEGIEFDDHVGP
jgi:1-acyl-sn-glycerol-3-phosphate acyltransferase